jgi:ribosomal protein S18 acetylase RimI-like enzyme
MQRQPEQDIELRAARAEDIASATAVTARAFRDNPMTMACWGSNPARRERGLRSLFGEFLPTLPTAPLVATRSNTIVGVLGMAPPGTCLQAPLGPTLRVLTWMLLRSPSTANRFRQWMVQYERRDLDEEHWHLGPVAVDPAFQHSGIGSRMLDRFCALVDEDHGVAYLETDAVDNIRLYERFGFETIGQQSILGTTNWFMRRGACA